MLAAPPHAMHWPSSSSSSSYTSTGSRLSLLTTSSTSTFSDLSSAPSIPPSPPASSTKTNAFFASPFSTQPSSPAPSPPPSLHASSQPARSLTADFFTAPRRQPTPPHHIEITPPDDVATPRPPNLEPSLALVQLHTEPESEPELELGPGSLVYSSTSPHRRSSTDPDSLLSPPTTPLTSSFTNRIKPLDQKTTVLLLTPLGQGSFSNVWLSQDLSPTPLALLHAHALHSHHAEHRAQHRSVVGMGRTRSLVRLGRRIGGTRPAESMSRERMGGIINERDGDAGVAMANPHAYPQGRLVAVKLTPRRPPGTSSLEAERTRVGFVREVEVLRHISHPSITPLLASLSTPTHHALVLPYLSGGDLLTLVNSDPAWDALSERILRRIWLELAGAVGWMHGVGLVHRDIKLENILLTTPLQTLNDTLPAHPLIQLTDFGLSRFLPAPSPIASAQEQREQQLLHTRCGSEAYAAPELVLGGPYDARETDAWACGVVLYALVARSLPFGEGPAAGGRRDRRAWLMRIARGEWEWPACGCTPDDERRSKGLAGSAGAQSAVARLMVRDPRKRARVAEVTDVEWDLGAEGACASPRCGVQGTPDAVTVEGEEGCAGWLVDADGIGDIARQEVF